MVDQSAVDRRTVLKGATSLAAVGSLAGCSSNGGGDGNDGGGDGGDGGSGNSEVDSYLSETSNYNGIEDFTGGDRLPQLPIERIILLIGFQQTWIFADGFFG